MKSQTENIMKQFNLDEYLKNPLKKVVTRDGRDVRIICTDFNNPKFPVIGEIEGSKWPISFTAKGLISDYAASDYDLFFDSEKHEGWLNLFKDTLGIIYGGCVYTSKDEAKEEEHPTDKESHVATIKIEWEE